MTSDPNVVWPFQLTPSKNAEEVEILRLQLELKQVFHDLLFCNLHVIYMWDNLNLHKISHVIYIKYKVWILCEIYMNLREIYTLFTSLI